MAHWLYPANIKFYDVIAAFGESQTYWPISSKVAVGDRVFIYLAAPHQQIAFVCEVMAIGLAQADIIGDIQAFFVGPKPGSNRSKTFMRLRTVSRQPIQTPSALSFAALKINGLGGSLMGPRKLENNPQLLAFIKGRLA